MQYTIWRMGGIGENSPWAVFVLASLGSALARRLKPAAAGLSNMASYPQPCGPIKKAPKKGAFFIGGQGGIAKNMLKHVFRPSRCSGSLGFASRPKSAAADFVEFGVIGEAGEMVQWTISNDKRVRSPNPIRQ